MCQEKKNCINAFYALVEKHDGKMPDTPTMQYWVRDYLINSLNGSEIGAKHWAKFILEETPTEYKEAVEKTLKELSPENIKVLHPEYTL